MMFSLAHRRFSQNSPLFDLVLARMQPWRKFPEPLRKMCRNFGQVDKNKQQVQM